MLYENTLPMSERRKYGSQTSLRDRQWLEETYLPSLSGSVLYVGVAYYTDFYHTMVKNPELFTTVDVDIKAAPFGSPYGHYVDEIEVFLDSTDKKYDHISIFGLFGQKHSVIKDEATIIRIFNKCCDHIKCGGTISFGAAVESLSIEQIRKIIDNSKLKDTKVISSFMCKPSDYHSEVFIFWSEIHAN